MVEEVVAKKIMIVEDNPVNQKVMQKLVTTFGHQFLALEDGHQVLASVSSYEPDLILMDVQLVEVSGSDLARKIKSDVNTSKIPIVMVTAFASPDDKERIIKESRCNGFLAKPFKPEELGNMIARFFPINKIEWKK